MSLIEDSMSNMNSKKAKRTTNERERKQCSLTNYSAWSIMERR